MINTIPPAFIFIIGALLFPFLKARWLKRIFQLLIPVVAFVDLLYMSQSQGTYWLFDFLNYQLILGRVDKLSLLFGYIFVIISFLGMVYALHVKEDGQHVATFLYVGSTLGVVFAGDFFSLFVFWEIMAVSSVFLIWYKKDKAALNAGFRYVLVHLFGGCMLLAGIIIHVVNTGSIEFNLIDFGNLSSKLILLGFIINAAVPPVHAWLADAYPEATVTGSVFLTAFTTKSAVYVLIRGFPGVELLVWLGAIMALYGVVYAVLENNIRRLLAYHIISQVGYMVCGVGLGTEMALSGSAAHAFCHILYKALLFMGIGGVIYVTGKNKLTELQGRNLYKKMPICLCLYMIGAFSISAVPLFNGFVSKTIIIAAAGEIHRPIIALMLELASIGTFLHTGLKLPYGVWFGKRRKGEPEEEIEAKEPPINMLIAMGFTALLCIVTGIFPQILYRILPYPIDYHPYTAYHVVAMIQLLLLTAAAFWLYIDKLGGEATISLDTDWFYRKPARLFLWVCKYPLNGLRLWVQDFLSKEVKSMAVLGRNPFTAPRILWGSMRVSITQIVAHLAGYEATPMIKESKERLNILKEIPCDENIYRTPIGWSVLAVSLFLFFWATILYGL